MKKLYLILFLSLAATLTVQAQKNYYFGSYAAFSSPKRGVTDDIKNTSLRDPLTSGYHIVAFGYQPAQLHFQLMAGRRNNARLMEWSASFSKKEHNVSFVIDSAVTHTGTVRLLNAALSMDWGRKLCTLRKERFSAYYTWNGTLVREKGSFETVHPWFDNHSVAKTKMILGASSRLHYRISRRLYLQANMAFQFMSWNIAEYESPLNGRPFKSVLLEFNWPMEATARLGIGYLLGRPYPVFPAVQQ